MIDLHCHLLPGVDDGPATLDEALALARLAVADGIRCACLTPHIQEGRYPNRRSALERATHDFRQALDDAGIALDVVAGGEVHLSVELLDLLAEDEIPFLGATGGYRVMLLEFPHNTIPVGADRLISKLFGLRIRPLIAHPERNTAVMMQPERLYPFVAQGCLVQVTAGSLAGRFGQKVSDSAHRLVENGWVTVVATDAHDPVHRPPFLSEGKAALEKRFGEETATRLAVTNPRLILEGEQL